MVNLWIHASAGGAFGWRNVVRDTRCSCVYVLTSDLRRASYISTFLHNFSHDYVYLVCYRVVALIDFLVYDVLWFLYVFSPIFFMVEGMSVLGLTCCPDLGSDGLIRLFLFVLILV